MSSKQNRPVGPHYALELIEDEVVRQVLYNITTRLQENLLLGFVGKHLLLEKTAGTYEIPHKLGFVPRDAWVTGLVVGGGTAGVTLNYGEFTKTHFSMTVTTSLAGAVAQIRMIVGRMKEEGY